MLGLLALALPLLVRAVFLDALDVEVECVGLHGEAAILRDFLLPAFDFFVNELFNAPAIDAYQMVMVMTDFLLEYRLA